MLTDKMDGYGLLKNIVMMMVRVYDTLDINDNDWTNNTAAYYNS